MRRLVLAAILLLATLPALAGIPEGVDPVFLLPTVEGKQLETATFWHRDGQWFADAQEWTDLGVVLHDDERGRTCSAQELGLAFEVNDADATVSITIPAARLNLQRGKVPGQDAPFAPAAPGVLLNYSLAGSVSEGSQALSLGHEVRTGGQWGVLSTTGQANWTNQDGADYRRGLTRWQKDDVGRQIVYEAGDVVVAGPMGAVNLGGVRVAKDPKLLDPATPTWGVPVVGGVALDPSTVRILANEAEVLRQDVGKGPFTIDRYSLRPGRNDTSVVVRDAFGREAVLSQHALYFAPTQLRDGLATWEVAAGKVRSGEDYGQMGASAAFAYGLSDRWTVRTSAQASEDAHHAVVGASTVMGSYGQLDVEVGRSSSAQGQGTHLAASYDYRGPTGGIHLELERNDNFWRLASPGAPDILERTSASWFYRPSTALAVRAGYADTRTTDTRTRFVDVGATYTHGAHQVAASALYDFERKEPRLEAGYRYTFGNGSSVSAQARKAPNVQTLALRATTSGEVAGRRYHAGTEVRQDARGTSGTARMDLLTQHGRASIQAHVLPGGGASVNGQLQGAVHIGAGGLTLLGNAPAAYAIVDVPGQANVPVRIGGRLVGKTDEDGRLVVGSVGALVPLSVEIDDKALPLAVQVGQTKKTVKAARGAGMHVVFPVKTEAARTFTVVGTKLDAGAVIKTANEETTLGYDGALFLEHPEPGMRGVVVGVCAFQLPEVLPEYGADTRLECQPLP